MQKESPKTNQVPPATLTGRSQGKSEPPCQTSEVKAGPTFGVTCKDGGRNTKHPESITRDQMARELHVPGALSMRQGHLDVSRS